ncbi:MAG: HlyD family efflux transporter periplasmic adaptor subunit [Desulfobacteraceae bacterium]|nr:HlyD family efflux transporter periplasmic adaptor subunit [Desulfobacteraceae bacterium]
MKKILSLMALCLVLPSILMAGEPCVVEKAGRLVTLTGYTRSNTVVNLSPEVAGRVVKVNYEIGDTLGKIPFMEIDTTFIDYRIKATRLSLSKLDRNRAKALSRVDYLEREFNRIDRLHKEDRETGVKRDAALEELTQARLDLELLAVEKQALANTLAEQVETRKRHFIRAPQGWVVTGKGVEPGDTVAVGTPLGKAADFSPMVVPLAVSSEELAAVQKLAAVEKPAKGFGVTVGGVPCRAGLNWINPVFNETTRKLAMELKIEDYPRPARGGIQCVLSLRLDTGGFSVPKSALTNRFDTPRITLAETGETINVVVLGETGDRYIIAPGDKIRKGAVLVENSHS